MRIPLLILALSLTCCGAPGEPAPEESQESVEAAGEALEPEGCGMVFSPQDLLLEATRSAVERWSAATGCDLSIGEGGVAVELALSIEKPDGTQGPGITDPDLSRIRIHQRAGKEQRVRTVAHEFCHVFGVGAEHSDTTGICGPKGHTYDIDAKSLADVCSRIPCRAFNPEVP